MTTKTYAARDSATSALRKIGLQARDYNFFITKVGDKFECRIGDAIAHLEALKNPKPVSCEMTDLRSKIMAEDSNSDLDDCSIDDLRHIAAELGIAKPKPKPKPKPKAKTAKVGRRNTDPVVKVSTISTMARELILDGKTNQEVWEVLQAKFNLDDSKRHYPTWYRCEMKRTGLLPRDA
jgi:hypothetical protein